MENMNLRRMAKAAKVPLWRIAEVLGISEPTMTRKLRRELDEDEKTRILDIISTLAKEETR